MRILAGCEVKTLGSVRSTASTVRPMPTDESQPEPAGTMKITFGPDGLRHLTAELPDHGQSLQIGLAHGQESITERRGGKIRTKASPVTAGDDDAELWAGEMLRRYLNEQAGEEVWYQVNKVHGEREQGRDVVLRSATQAPLYVQVVSADIDQERWRYYRHVPSGSFYGEDEVTVEQAAERLIKAIGLKEQRFAPNAKRGLVLLLDARGVPEASDPAVRKEVRANAGDSTFAEIYVAGLTENLVWRVR